MNLDGHDTGKTSTKYEVHLLNCRGEKVATYQAKRPTMLACEQWIAKARGPGRFVIAEKAVQS